MKRDRRIACRTVPDRRRSDRIADYRPIVWFSGNRHRLGWLVDHSAEGLAMIVQADETPPRDSAIAVGVHGRQGQRLDTCRVVRLEKQTPVLNLVTAEYVRAPGAVPAAACAPA